MHQPRADRGPADEGPERERRPDDGAAVPLHDGQPEEHGVAGHVGGEDATKGEVVDGVHVARGAGEQEHERLLERGRPQVFSKSIRSYDRQILGDSGAGNRGPARPRPGAPTRGRRGCGCAARRRRPRRRWPRQMVPPRSIRSAPSSRSIRTASAWVGRPSLGARPAPPLLRLAGVSSPSAPAPGRRRRTPERGRATTTARRNIFSAPGRWREARGDLATGERLHDGQRALPLGQRGAAPRPPASASSSPRMKLPSRLRTSRSTGASLRRRRPCRRRARSAWSRAAGSARGSRASRCRRARASSTPVSSESTCDSPSP